MPEKVYQTSLFHEYPATEDPIAALSRVAFRGLKGRHYKVLAALGALGATGGTFVPLERVAGFLEQKRDSVAKSLRELDGAFVEFRRSKNGTGPALVTLLAPASSAAEPDCEEPGRAAWEPGRDPLPPPSCPPHPPKHPPLSRDESGLNAGAHARESEPPPAAVDDDPAAAAVQAMARRRLGRRPDAAEWRMVADIRRRYGLTVAAVEGAEERGMARWQPDAHGPIRTLHFFRADFEAIADEREARGEFVTAQSDQPAVRTLPRPKSLPELLRGRSAADDAAERAMLKAKGW